MNLLQLLKSFFPSKIPASPPPPPPPILPLLPSGPLYVVDILTSSNQYPDRLESPECTQAVKDNVITLLSRVNPLLRELGITQIKVNSGFRTIAANQAAGGALASCHLLGMAVDLHDPDNSLEARITDELLEKYDLYRESPGNTRGWTHLDFKKRNTRTYQIGLRVVK